MKSRRIGFLFPAFAMKFTGSHPLYQEEFDTLLASASKLVPIDLKRFREMSEGVIEDELQAHYFCYLNSGVVSFILSRQNITPDYVSGYSMGLFAALFHAGVVSFEDGLLLMHNVYSIALKSTDERRYGMGVVVGLTYDRVEGLIRDNCENVDIIDVSNEHVINVTGIYEEVVRFLEVASTQAIHTKMLPITLPYHSRFVTQAAEKIREYLMGVKINAPVYKAVSCVNQKILSTAQDIRDELYDNVSNRINWFKTMQKMLELDITLFVECGMSKSLTQLAKFIDGNYSIYNITTLSRIEDDED